MPISQQLLTKVNNALSDLAARVENRESIYFAQRGHYFQGLLTPSEIPIDGADTTPELTLKPTDQIENWMAANLPASLPFAIRIDTHSGPLGQGYTESAWVKLSNGEIWMRSRGVGAYGVTTQGWDHVIVVDD